MQRLPRMCYRERLACVVVLPTGDAGLDGIVVSTARIQRYLTGSRANTFERVDGAGHSGGGESAAGGGTAGVGVAGGVGGR